jgi:ribose/xylose/arabinose/galactoside ABC-type transport system permease subunit
MTRILKGVPMIVASVILGVLIANDPVFQRAAYWRYLGQSYFPAAILALALTPIMLTGGIDLSIGSVTVFSSVVIGTLWQDLGWPIELALIGGILAGGLAGLMNGGLISLGVMPLVATLATRELFRGLAKRLSGVFGVSGFPRQLNDIWSDNILGVPTPVLGVALAAVATYIIVHQTWIGRMLFAVGDNETAARFAGVPVRRLKLGLYAAAGLTAGVCGASVVCEYGSAKADALTSLELTAIACVVLGGVRVTGGSGHVAGTLLGTVTMAALLSGLQSVAAEWRETITGALVIAVAVGNEAALKYSDRLQLGRAKTPPPPLPEAERGDHKR